MSDKSTTLPLHQQITQELRRRLRNGVWEDGVPFPTNKCWMEKFGVSIGTMRQAIDTLVQEGWLIRDHGKGTFVHLRQVSETLGTLSGFFEEIRARGGVPSAQIMQSCHVDLDESLLESLPVLRRFEQKRLYLVHKIQCMNKAPVASVQSYWPEHIGNSLMGFDLSRHGVYEVIDQLGIRRDSADQSISACTATPELAAYLHIPEGFPLLRMERTLYGHGQLLGFSLYYYRSDRYSYQLRLTM